jgi:hypothetical protein
VRQDSPDKGFESPLESSAGQAAEKRAQHQSGGLASAALVVALLAVAIGTFITIESRSRDEHDPAYVLGKMHVLQLAIESYAVDEERYPLQLRDTEPYFPGGSSNPKVMSSTRRMVCPNGLFLDLNIPPERLTPSAQKTIAQKHVGLLWVGYSVSRDRRHYAIIGADEDGDFVCNKSGQIVILHDYPNDWVK